MLHDLVVTPGMPSCHGTEESRPARAGDGAAATPSDDARAGAGAMQGSVDVLENGLPMFLTQLAERLSADERVVSMVHRPVRCEADSSTCADQV
jgi:hypothetical protein